MKEKPNRDPTKFIQGHSVKVEKIKNTQGSVAGAGSGEIHVYLNLRRHEMKRQAQMQMELKRKQR